jgi:hypothetical protein
LLERLCRRHYDELFATTTERMRWQRLAAVRFGTCARKRPLTGRREVAF